jgi:hypothetical protein
MLITFRFPRSSAVKLNLVVADADGQEQDFETALTAVELAGRLSLATGKPISPEAVVGYCIAWQAATRTLAGLVRKHGDSRLAKMVRKGCWEQAVWVPRTNASALKWLQCVLESHFLSHGESLNDAGMPESPLEVQLQTDVDLAELCRANFPQAYGLWVAGEGSRTPGGSESGGRESSR